MNSRQSATAGMVKHRNKAKTLADLRDAVSKLERSGSKITISSVAREAKVTPSLIHNTYPDVAERIRQLMGKAIRLQRDAQSKEARRQAASNRNLLDEISRLKADYADLASANLSLLTELDRLKTMHRSNVAMLPTRKMGPE